MAGTLAASITQLIVAEYRTADYTGAGTLTVAAMLPVYSKPAALAATGALAGTVTARYARSAALAGAGTLAATGSQKYAPTAPLAATGALAATTATTAFTPITIENTNVTAGTAVPTGCAGCWVTLIGQGGGGGSGSSGGASTGRPGGGGGGGGAKINRTFIPIASLGPTYSVTRGTVGGGGGAGTGTSAADGNNGVGGAASSFVSGTISWFANGGGGGTRGIVGQANQAAGAGGTASATGLSASTDNGTAGGPGSINGSVAPDGVANGASDSGAAGGGGSVGVSGTNTSQSPGGPGGTANGQTAGTGGVGGGASATSGSAAAAGVAGAGAGGGCGGTAANSAGANATGYGGGGGGGGGHASGSVGQPAGNGGPGYTKIEWVDTAPIAVVTSAVNNNITTGSADRSVTFAGYTPVLNDVVVLFSATLSTSALYNVAPSGWTLLTGPTTQWTGTSVKVSGGIYHVVNAADVSGGVTTYTATGYASVSSFSTSLGAVLRNVNLADVTDAWDGIAVTGSATTQTIEGGMTASSASGLWLSVMAKANTTAYPAAPAGWTTLQSGTNATGSAGAYRLLYRNALTSPGTLADVTFTGTGITGSYCSVSVVISSA